MALCKGKQKPGREGSGAREPCQTLGHVCGVARAQGASEDVVAAQVAPSPEDPQPLSAEEIEEKEALLGEGFSAWNRRDFNAFVRACEKARPAWPPPLAR